MKYIYFIIGLSLFSCGQKENKIEADNASTLFNESVLIISQISNRISLAKDSDEVDSLFEIFDKKITEINFSFPPETDFNMTEEDNDSIFKLLENLQKIRALKLKNLADIKQDSIN